MRVYDPAGAAMSEGAATFEYMDEQPIALPPDPQAESWADSLDAWVAALDEDAAGGPDAAGAWWGEAGFGEEHAGAGAGAGPGAGVHPLGDADPDEPFRSGLVHDDALEQLEVAAVHARRLVAEQYRLIAEVLAGASAFPDPWVGPDPTLDPAWSDPRKRTVAAVRRERADIAVRAAAADVAVRLRLSEQQVRARAAYAGLLRERCPAAWRLFLAGRVEERNAVVVAQQVAALPGDAPEAWAAFDAAVTDAAERLTPGKFRIRARAVRERVHPEHLDARHDRARADRSVWITAEHDGMATLAAHLPAVDAYAAMNRIDTIARHLRRADDESRTLAQLRADTLADLLTAFPGGGAVAAEPNVAGDGGVTAPDRSAAAEGAGARGDGHSDGVTRATGESRAGDADGNGGAEDSVPVAAGVRATVAITVPVMSLLGQGDEPATLDGYGPIPLDTAKMLAGGAASWVRILTHPVTGSILTLDRTVYRVPAALRRWLAATHRTCVFPGCSRPARQCEIDHRIDWARGGATDADNLAPECEPHHRVKTESLWHPATDPDTGEIVWISPTGRATEPDPPPF